jgi:hypothetical protein
MAVVKADLVCMCVVRNECSMCEETRQLLHSAHTPMRQGFAPAAHYLGTIPDTFTNVPLTTAISADYFEGGIALIHAADHQNSASPLPPSR